MNMENESEVPDLMASSQEVQKICCFNSGAFLMHFTVAYLDDTGTTRYYGGSGDYAVGEYRVIDMSTAPGITPGTWIWARPTAVAGSTIEAVKKVKYSPNLNVSTYRVHGTTLSVKCDLVE
jgi:hypothetical protein